MTGIEIVGLLIANAPAAVQTLAQLKNLFMGGYEDVKAAIGEDATREQILALMDEIKRKSDEIQNID